MYINIHKHTHTHTPQLFTKNNLIKINTQSLRASLQLSSRKSSPAVQEMQVQSLGQEDPLENKMAAHFSILAWEIPWTEEPSRLQSIGWQSRTRLSD